ncbi:MAG TPA: hypothetical protein VHC67_02605 [Gaiellaceae bacterium]|jgi:hypothetical protein|nr:hypothetical protein [Gaiellaceae bacterium]
MQRARFATTVLVATAAVATVASTASAASKAGNPPCLPKVTKIAGHIAAVGCGPATATLRIGGKSYTFRNGFCSQSKTSGAAPQLDLGTTVTGVAGNAGKADFHMLVDARIHSAFGSGSVFNADYGGRRILGDSLIKVHGSPPSRGTFNGTTATGVKFTGSWNCHGFVWQRP